MRCGASSVYPYAKKEKAPAKKVTPKKEEKKAEEPKPAEVIEVIEVVAADAKAEEPMVEVETVSEVADSKSKDSE